MNHHFDRQHGNGKNGLDVSDMVLKLSGVMELTDLSGIVV